MAFGGMSYEGMPSEDFGEDMMMLEEDDDVEDPSLAPEKEGVQATIRRLANQIWAGDELRTQNAVSQLKDMVLSTNRRQRFHQDCIGEVDGALRGLVFAARNGNATAQYHACLALAQLAWSHDENSARIPQVPGAMEVLAEILMAGPADRAQEYAAVAVGNCGANSPSAAETLVQNQNLMQALAMVIRRHSNRRLQETAALALKNCCSNGEPAAYAVARNPDLLSTVLELACCEASSRLQSMGLGAINCLSRSFRAAKILRRSGVVEDVLWPFMATATAEENELVMLTIMCALVNLTSSQKEVPAFVAWAGTQSGLKCVKNLVHCLGLALNEGRWQNVSFSRHSVMYPLHKLLSCCPHITRSLLEHRLVDHLDQLLWWTTSEVRALETLGLALRSLRCLCADPTAQVQMRKRGVVSSLQRIAELQDSAQEWRLQLEDHALVREMMALARQIVLELYHPVVVLCMGHHFRLGAASQLRVLDSDCLMLISNMAFYESYESHQPAQASV